MIFIVLAVKCLCVLLANDCDSVICQCLSTQLCKPSTGLRGIWVGGGVGVGGRRKMYVVCMSHDLVCVCTCANTCVACVNLNVRVVYAGTCYGQDKGPILSLLSYRTVYTPSAILLN